MKKEKKASDVSRIKSIMGQSNYNKALVAEVRSGATVEEAHELVERRALRLSK